MIDLAYYNNQPQDRPQFQFPIPSFQIRYLKLAYEKIIGLKLD